MQLALSYDASHEGATLWQLELAWIRRAVDVIGHKEVAYALDVQPSNLTDALLERERKDVKAKWISTIVRMAPDEMRAEWVRLTADANGYEMPTRKKPRTADEDNRARREWLEKHAPAVLAIMDKELGR